MDIKKFTIFKEDEIPDSIEGIDIVQNEFIVLKEYLAKGEKVARFEFGDSMSPLLCSGQFCILTPLAPNEEVNIGDIVFSVIGKTLNTHMVILKTTTDDTTWYLIGDSMMRPIGWTQHIFAKAKGIPYKVQQDKSSFKKEDWGRYTVSESTRPSFIYSNDASQDVLSHVNVPHEFIRSVNASENYEESCEEDSEELLGDIASDEAIPSEDVINTSARLTAVYHGDTLTTASRNVYARSGNS